MPRFDFPSRSKDDEDQLELTGALIEVEITVPVQLKHYLEKQGILPMSVRSGLAMFDTGASVSVIDEEVFAEMGYPRVGMTETYTPHGLAKSNLFSASVNFPSIDLHELPLNRVIGGDVRRLSPSGQEVVMLVGRDVLSRLRFTYDGPNSSFSIET